MHVSTLQIDIFKTSVIAIRRLPPDKQPKNKQIEDRHTDSKSISEDDHQPEIHNLPKSPLRSKTTTNHQKQVTFSCVPKRHYYTLESTFNIDQRTEDSSAWQQPPQRHTHRSRSCHTQVEVRKQFVNSPIVTEISDKLDTLGKS